jgi:hypothetical protein
LENASLPSTGNCRFCHRAFAVECYHVNGQQACAICARKASEGGTLVSHTTFMRSVTLGVGAAVICFALYSVLAILIHFYLGFIGLIIGWVIAAAMMKGSNDLGDKRFQIVAVLLTYVAISMSAVPVYIVHKMQHRYSTSASAAPAPASSASPDSSAPAQKASAHPKPAPLPAPQQKPAVQQKPAARPPIHFASVAKDLVLLGLASPIINLTDPIEGFLGIAILLIAMRVAWRVTRNRSVSVFGPYSLTTA